MNLETLKQLRNDLMEEEKLLREVGSGPNGGPEVTLALRAHQCAMMMVGNTIKNLSDHSSYPYKDSMDPSNKNIDALHIDEGMKPFVVPADWEEMSQIESIKVLRVLVEERLKEVTLIRETVKMIPHDTTSIEIALLTMNEVIINLILCKNWLGQQLGIIRDRAK